MTERFYVTIIRDRRIGVLAGPYPTKGCAEQAVAAAYEKACAADPWAHFDAFGVTMIDSAEPKRTMFGMI
jgi:hypothetical protein